MEKSKKNSIVKEISYDPVVVTGWDNSALVQMIDFLKRTRRHQVPRIKECVVLRQQVYPKHRITERENRTRCNVLPSPRLPRHVGSQNAKNAAMADSNVKNATSSSNAVGGVGRRHVILLMPLRKIALNVLHASLVTLNVGGVRARNAAGSVPTHSACVSGFNNRHRVGKKSDF